ncbi:uncharacterized protein AB9W97_003707 [Spinachia spinachia]
MAMYRIRNAARVLSHTGKAVPVPPSLISRHPFRAPGDPVCLEEVMGPQSQLSCPSAPSSSPGCSPYSVSSGVTAPLHSPIKKRSQTASQTRLAGERRLGTLTGCPFRGPHWRATPLWEQVRGGNRTKPPASAERVGPRRGRGSARTHGSAKSLKLHCPLEEKIEGKVKFSRFLNEVTSNILDPNSLQAFGKAVSPSGFPAISPPQPEDEIQAATQWSPWLPCSMARRRGSLLERWTSQAEQTLLAAAERNVVETDVDTVDLEFCEGFEMTSPVAEFRPDSPPYPYGPVSLPRSINMVSEESRPSF